MSEHSNTDEVIAANIVRLRQKAGLSQTALADAMRAAGQYHWHQTTVSRVESGKQSVSIGEMRALGAILGNIIEGTALAKTVEGLGDRYVEARLRDVEQRLSAALDEVRELREVFGDEDGQ